MRVTMQDVAEAAGVSIATVSKVINKVPGISEPTIQKVRRVIDDLGYRPNKRAQSFARRATRKILFLADFHQGIGFENPHLFEILAGIEQTLTRRRFGLLIRGLSPADFADNLDRCLDSDVADGAIIHASLVTPQVAEALSALDFPYVIVGMPDFKNNLCWIDSNNYVAGEIAAKHLESCGYRDIAFFGGPKTDTISEHRLSGIQRVLRKPIPDEFVQRGKDATSEQGYFAAKKLLDADRVPEAIICANQYIAFGCFQILKAYQLNVPRDIALMTFDDFPFSKELTPQLTVVDLDMYAMGEQAATIVIRRINRPNLLVQTYTTVPTLIERNSTRRN